MDRIPVTREGYDKMMKEVEEMEDKMVEVIAEISRTRAFGDLSENAEYHAAREMQGMLQAKMDQKRGILTRSYIVDQSKLPKDEIVFGAIAKVKDLDLDDEEEFHFVGQGQEDYKQNKVLITSPIGQGLLGKKVGDVVEIEVPQGKIRFEVLAIRHE